jgi:hypothetical protein
MAIDFGLDLDSDFGNLDQVINKLLRARDEQNISEEFMQLFLNLLEIGWQKRVLERQMREIQRKTYQGKVKMPAPDSSETFDADTLSDEKV